MLQQVGVWLLRERAREQLGSPRACAVAQLTCPTVHCVARVTAGLHCLVYSLDGREKTGPLWALKYHGQLLIFFSLNW